VPSQKFEALPQAATSALFSELERRAIRYAEEMTEKVQVDPALVAALRRDLGDAGLVQLTQSIAAANFTTRFNEALGTDLEARTASPAARP
jgi:alkylhydroperoxidase family enzyme